MKTDTKSLLVEKVTKCFTSHNAKFVEINQAQKKYSDCTVPEMAERCQNNYYMELLV